MFREIPVTKKFKGHKKLVADNAVQLPLKHCQKKKKKNNSCYTNQFTQQKNEAYFEGYLGFLRYSKISVYSTISLGTPLVFCRILTMQYTDNLFFPDLTMLNSHKTHTRRCHL